MPRRLTGFRREAPGTASPPAHEEHPLLAAHPHVQRSPRAGRPEGELQAVVPLAHMARERTNPSIRGGGFKIEIHVSHSL